MRRSILSGVEYLHQHDVVHRDLKCVLVSMAVLWQERHRLLTIPSSGLRIYSIEAGIQTVTLLLLILACASPWYLWSSQNILDIFVSAKHLESAQEVLHNLSGSFGYVAPEVLSNLGHGKPVDIWSTGCVVLFGCCYLPVSICAISGSSVMCSYVVIHHSDLKSQSYSSRRQ